MPLIPPGGRIAGLCRHLSFSEIFSAASPKWAMAREAGERRLLSVIAGLGGWDLAAWAFGVPAATPYKA
jgi:hypothetical protein